MALPSLELHSPEAAFLFCSLITYDIEIMIVIITGTNTITGTITGIKTRTDTNTKTGTNYYVSSDIKRYRMISLDLS